VDAATTAVASQKLRMGAAEIQEPAGASDHRAQLFRAPGRRTGAG